MKKLVFSIFTLVLSLHLSAQSNFYLKPTVGAVWNSYSSSNTNITGTEEVSQLLGDNDWIFELLAGYQFENNFVLESGLIYHNAANRYYLNYEELSHRGGSSVSLGEGFLCVPLNVKYAINPGIKGLKILPYVGVSLSTHKINDSPYSSRTNIIYQEGSFPDNPVPVDTSSVVKAYRPTKANVLLNYGLGIEYQLFEKLIFTFSGNFTSGFNTLNRVDVDVFLSESKESGSIAFKGQKFYLSGGIVIPIGG